MPFKKTKTEAERFWEKVDKNGPVPAHRPELGPCWLWIGGRVTDGYGAFFLSSGKRIGAHRYSLQQALGVELPAHVLALHHCDNPPCVNDAHLFAGSHRENTKDSMRKGRWPKRGVSGEHHWNARLTADDVRLLRQRAQAGEASDTLAKDFGISARNTRRIVAGTTWKEKIDADPNRSQS